MLKKLLVLSFIEGAAVMASELCGAKLLAPVFGSSLFVWASVMGVTLAALALGYFYGGWTTERSQDHHKTLSKILNGAALFVIVMPLVSYYLIPRLSYLLFLPGVVLSTVALLFLPVFLLGASSPLFILIQTNEHNLSGKVSGTVYAISTTGGIFATFLCGFYLIPFIGLNACLFVFGGVLFFANIFVFKFLKPGAFILLATLSYLNMQFITKKIGSIMTSDSILGRLQVKDIVVKDSQTYRILTVNDIIQTEMNLTTRKSVSEYVKLIDTLVNISFVSKNALVLGLGGGLNANLLAEKNYNTDGVELDQRIIDAAKAYFYLNKNVNTFYEDARYFLNHCKKKYSIVLVDIFKGEEQPSHILTLESLKKLKTNLSDSALVLINWHGYTKGDKGLGTAIVINTLREAGFSVKLCSYSTDENHRNILFVASLHLLKNIPYELNEDLKATSLINSDNLPLLEKYNAEANKTWRLNYLRYYQNKN
jgi:predicted membrane-bound spermidine synthase